MRTKEQVSMELEEAIIELETAQKPPRLTVEDVEDVSDNYQDNLEYSYWIREQEDLIQELKKELESFK